MGLNYNLLILKNESPGISEVEKEIRDISKEFLLLESKADFGMVLKMHTECNCFAIAKYDKVLIVSDERHTITDRIVNSKINCDSMLRAESQSTVEVQEVEYWENSLLIRKYSLGVDAHMEDFLEELPPEVVEQIMNENEEFGSPQGFEKNGKSTYKVLETYGIGESIILDLDAWDIFGKRNLTPSSS